MVWKLFAITESGVWLLTAAVVNSVPVVAGMNDTFATATEPDDRLPSAQLHPPDPSVHVPWVVEVVVPVAPTGTPGISVTCVAAAGPPLVTVIV